MENYNEKKKNLTTGKILNKIKTTPVYIASGLAVAAIIIPISLWWTYDKITNNNSPNENKDSDD